MTHLSEEDGLLVKCTACRASALDSAHLQLASNILTGDTFEKLARILYQARYKIIFYFVLFGLYSHCKLIAKKKKTQNNPMGTFDEVETSEDFIWIEWYLFIKLFNCRTRIN